MNEIVTAGILVIGDEILSGRTKDKNIGFIAEYLTNIGIDLKEVRVVADDEADIISALDALRHRYTYVFTTGGIGPTHDDITVDAIAEALGVAVVHHPRALAVLNRYYETRGGLTEARKRMARVPNGADLIENRMSGAPGIRIGNIFVMAGVPHITAGMLDALTGKGASEATREAFLQRFRDGHLNATEIEIEVEDAAKPAFEVPGQMGMINLSEMMSKAMGGQQLKRRKLTVPAAWNKLVEEEADKRLDQDEVSQVALADAEANGIVFLDEIDKIAVSDDMVRMATSSVRNCSRKSEAPYSTV